MLTEVFEREMSLIQYEPVNSLATRARLSEQQWNGYVSVLACLT